jgi:hypothetical protein
MNFRVGFGRKPAENSQEQGTWVGGMNKGIILITRFRIKP